MESIQSSKANTGTSQHLDVGDGEFYPEAHQAENLKTQIFWVHLPTGSTPDGPLSDPLLAEIALQTGVGGHQNGPVGSVPQKGRQGARHRDGDWALFKLTKDGQLSVQ